MFQYIWVETCKHPFQCFRRKLTKIDQCEICKKNTCSVTSVFTNYHNSSNWNLIIRMIEITVLLSLMFQFCKH